MKSVVILDSEYFRSHQKSPRGRGGWAFAFARNAPIEDVVFAPSMTYREACAWVKKLALGKLESEPCLSARSFEHAQASAKQAREASNLIYVYTLP